jgi:hypothetical protein
MKNNLKSILFLIILISILVIPYFVFAQSALDNLKILGNQSGYSQTDNDQYAAAAIVGTFVSVFFSILGIIFVVLMLYGGYNWMTAMGDNAKVEKGQDTIKRAIIGLIITVSSWAIWYFIFIYFLGAGTTGVGGGTG